MDLDSTIHIKNMVCKRCQMAVQSVLEHASIPYSSVELGWAKLDVVLTPVQRINLQEELKRYDLELIEGKTKILVERIKTEIIRLLHEPHPLQLKLSVYLSQMLGYNYTYLANTFSELEEITLERYFITQRIERAKELMVYEDMSVKEITEELNFSSVSHLCLQFKKVSGNTPAEFKKLLRSENFVWRKV